MNIKAVFPSGVTELTVNGLHQWDYGRKLEIHASDLPALVEVHFACAGMTEAVVRSCAVVNGVATAVIPDKCLEQTTPVLAWVYEIGGSTGITTKTLRLNIIARTKPNPGASIPPEVSDRYTELITAVNEKVDELEGELDAKVSAAEGRINTNLTNATNAISEEQTLLEENCDAKYAELNLKIYTRLADSAFAGDYTAYNNGDRLDAGVYMFKEADPMDDNSDSVFLLDTKGGCSALVMYYQSGLAYGQLARYNFKAEDGGKFSVQRRIYEAPNTEPSYPDLTYQPFKVATNEEAGGVFYRPIILY